MWLHRDVGDDYIRQMNGEERDENGKWVEKGANHLLDCEVYAGACAHPDWTPALQLLPEPTYRSTAAPKRPAGREGLGGSPLGGRIVNPYFNGGR
jgi:phage terminase large subunit GpA-like protein